MGERTDTTAWNIVQKAMRDAGYFDSAVHAAMVRASEEINQLSDEQLMDSWIRADKAVLAQTDDWTRAIREALLLVTRPVDGPIVCFTRHDMHAYLLPGNKDGDRVSCPFDTYDSKGQMQIQGLLRIDGNPTPERVRTLAVRMLDEALQSQTSCKDPIQTMTGMN